MQRPARGSVLGRRGRHLLRGLVVARAIDARRGRRERRQARRLDPAIALVAQAVRAAVEPVDRGDDAGDLAHVAVAERGQDARVPLLGGALDLLALVGLELLVGARDAVAVTGQELLPGNGLETIGGDSSVRIRYLNVVTMDVDGETLLHQWLEEFATGGTKAVSVKRGALRVTIPSSLPGRPLMFSTPHLDVQSASASFRLIVTPQSTRFLVEQGALRATRREDNGSTALLA